MKVRLSFLVNLKHFAIVCTTMFHIAYHPDVFFMFLTLAGDTNFRFRRICLITFWPFLEVTLMMFECYK